MQSSLKAHVFPASFDWNTNAAKNNRTTETAKPIAQVLDPIENQLLIQNAVMAVGATDLIKIPLQRA